MKAYISISRKNRRALESVISTINSIVHDFGIESFVFLDHFNFSPQQEREMMACALQKIDDCDILIAEVSDKAIGIGVEAGYGRGKGKPVIFIRDAAAEHSTTLSGISEFHIVYKSVSELTEKLSDVLKKVIILLNREDTL